MSAVLTNHTTAAIQSTNLNQHRNSHPITNGTTPIVNNSSSASSSSSSSSSSSNSSLNPMSHGNGSTPRLSPSTSTAQLVALLPNHQTSASSSSSSSSLTAPDSSSSSSSSTPGSTRLGSRRSSLGGGRADSLSHPDRPSSSSINASSSYSLPHSSSVLSPSSSTSPAPSSFSDSSSTIASRQSSDSVASQISVSAINLSGIITPYESSTHSPASQLNSVNQTPRKTARLAPLNPIPPLPSNSLESSPTPISPTTDDYSSTDKNAAIPTSPLSPRMNALVNKFGGSATIPSTGYTPRLSFKTTSTSSSSSIGLSPSPILQSTTASGSITSVAAVLGSTIAQPSPPVSQLTQALARSEANGAPRILRQASTGVTSSNHNNHVSFQPQHSSTSTANSTTSPSTSDASKSSATTVNTPNLGPMVTPGSAPAAVSFLSFAASSAGEASFTTPISPPPLLEDSNGASSSIANGLGGGTEGGGSVVAIFTAEEEAKMASYKRQSSVRRNSLAMYVDHERKIKQQREAYLNHKRLQALNLQHHQMQQQQLQQSAANHVNVSSTPNSTSSSNSSNSISNSSTSSSSSSSSSATSNPSAFSSNLSFSSHMLQTIYLPRGGYYVSTPAGPVQFGLPPETIKDSMKAGLTLPSTFVIPKERFNLQMGINVAEFEFPAYYTFFFKRKRINLITTKEVEPLIRTIFRETLLGPPHVTEPPEYSEKVPKEKYPDLEKEMSFFRISPFDKTPLTVDSLLAFSYFNEDGVVELDHGVCIRDLGDEYIVLDAQQNILATVPCAIILTPPTDGMGGSGMSGGSAGGGGERDEKPVIDRYGSRQSISGAAAAAAAAAAVLGPLVTGSNSHRESNSNEGREKSLLSSTSSSSSSSSEAEYFIPPHFGITMLGNSDGFDKDGTTTGFVLWMNRRGIMVDPPPHSGFLLKKHGISARLMRGVILTHCHADHDAGTFQKILEEGRIVLMTTEIILNSFLTKYSAISGLDKEFLQKLFLFRPIIVGKRTAVYGGELEFFYSLHSIPCVGFAAYCNNKSMVYSGDSFNDPSGIQKLYDAGCMSQGRRNCLVNFPWYHDLILHEAGVPPIHTPLATLQALPEEVKRKLYIVHKSPNGVAGTEFKSALVGPSNTLIISHLPAANSKAMEVLDLVGSIDIFSGFPISRGLEMVECATYERFKKGEALIEEGSCGSTVFIIAMGTVAVSINSIGVIKLLTVGDHFGEMSAIASTVEKRTATIRAMCEVEVITFPKHEFLHLLRSTNVIERLRQLGVNQRSDAWKAIDANSVLAKLSSAQKSYLQSIMKRRFIETNAKVWATGEPATEALLVASGQFVFSRAADMPPFTTGTFIGDMQELLSESCLSTTLQCTVSGWVYYIDRKELNKFFDQNPGFKLFFMKRRFIE